MRNLKSTAKNFKTTAKDLKTNTSLSLSKLFNNIYNYIFKALYLDKVDKNYLILFLAILRLFIKTLVITNVIIAFLLYASKILDVENPYTWEIIPLLFGVVITFFSEMFIDCKNKIYQILRYIVESLVQKLHEVKYNQDLKSGLNNKLKTDVKSKITRYAQDTYQTYKDNNKLDNLQPTFNMETLQKWAIIFGFILIASYLIFMIYAWYNYLDLDPNVMVLYHIFLMIPKFIFIDIPKRIFYDLPTSIYKRSKKLFNKIFINWRKKGGDGLPKPSPSLDPESTPRATPDAQLGPALEGSLPPFGPEAPLGPALEGSLPPFGPEAPLGSALEGYLPPFVPEAQHDSAPQGSLSSFVPAPPGSFEPTPQVGTPDVSLEGTPTGVSLRSRTYSCPFDMFSHIMTQPSINSIDAPFPRVPGRTPMEIRRYYGGLGHYNDRGFLHNFLYPGAGTDPRLMGYREWVDIYINDKPGAGYHPTFRR